MEITISRNFLIGLFLVGLASILFFTKGFGLIGMGSAVTGGGIVKIPLTEVSNQAKWYEYDASGTKVKFFVVKANDGTVKTAIDACDVCYDTKKGYSQDGEYMVCNNCGNRYLISELGTKNKEGGGCWPGYLPSKIEGDNVIIKQSDLENEKWRF